MEQERPSLHGFVFRNIWALDQPPLAVSTITGDVSDVTFDNVKYGQTRVTSNAQMPVVVSGGAAQPAYAPAPALAANFSVDPLVFAARQRVTLTAKEVPGAQYTWLFGDGTTADGRRVQHRFPDALGTELDGEMAQADSAYCCTSRTRPAIRIGLRRESWPLSIGTKQ